MEQLIKQIEQWAEDRNIIKGSKPIDQAMKLFSEFGELADNVGKGRDCRDDIGDCLVVATIICAQNGSSIISQIEIVNELASNGLRVDIMATSKDAAVTALHSLSDWCGDDFGGGSLVYFIEALAFIAEKNGYDLEECVQIAYNDIKDRKGIMSNGVFVKESDPAYESIIKSIEDNFNAG